jgi:hypothetical protein
MIAHGPDMFDEFRWIIFEIEFILDSRNRLNTRNKSRPILHGFSFMGIAELAPCSLGRSRYLDVSPTGMEFWLLLGLMPTKETKWGVGNR